MTLSTHTPAGGPAQQFADTPDNPDPVQQASQASAALIQADGIDGTPDAHGHKLIEETLAAHYGKISHAALQMRASRGTLYRRLKHWRENAPE